MAGTTQELVSFLGGLGYESIPERVRERVKDLTIDAIGNAVAGHAGVETPQVQALASALGASAEATIIGGDRLSLAGATILNAYLITAVTACDVHRPTLCHITPEVIPPALAIAERDGATGRDLLVALVAGHEAATRVGLGWNFPAARKKGWHAPGVIGPFGAATAVGRLRGLDEPHLRRAFGLAGSQAAGTFAAWGTPTVKFHQARGALSGLMAALLAEQGFVASEQFLEHPDGGLFTTYTDAPRPDEAVANLGERWELENISLRLWPAATGLQQVITALLALIAAHDLRPQNVERVCVALPQVVYDMHGAIGWEGKFRALLSPRYVAAVVLHERQCWLDQFVDEKLADPVLSGFARDRVEIVLDAALPEAGAAVEVTTHEGAVYRDRRDVPKGHPADPLTRDEVDGKFRVACAPVLAPDVVERALTMLRDLERLRDVRELMAVLRAPR